MQNLQMNCRASRLGAEEKQRRDLPAMFGVVQRHSMLAGMLVVDGLARARRRRPGRALPASHSPLLLELIGGGAGGGGGGGGPSP
jgi:hypothetical protein